MHKHYALAEIIRLLTNKERGISYLETHAGRGLYDLSSDQAQKTGEAAEGIALLDPQGTAFADALSIVRTRYGENAYPGSPLVASSLLRPHDHIVLMERHPQEHAALKRAVRGTGAEVHRRDGYEGARALSPMEPRRGLVLIDPPYEVKTEYEEAARLALDIRARWPEAAVMVWYPVLAAGRHEALLSALVPGEPLVDEVAFALKEGKGMTGSGLAILGAPYGTEAAMAEVLQRGQPVLRRPARV